VAGERFTAKATRYLVLADLSPSRTFDDVKKRIALRTVEEWTILHNQRPRLGKRLDAASLRGINIREPFTAKRHD
jgi:hypothetical protein